MPFYAGTSIQMQTMLAYQALSGAVMTCDTLLLVTGSSATPGYENVAARCLAVEHVAETLEDMMICIKLCTQC
jgi:hypothetical protein